MKRGDTARVIQPEIKGEIKDRRITETDDIELLLEWTPEGGEPTQRWFDADQLEPAQ